MPSRPIRDLASAASLFALNAFICWRLFFTHYVPHMFSIEAAYITLTRYTAAHFPDLLWFPLWQDGMPFQNTYQLGLPLLTAMVSRVFHWEPALAYHFTIALLYTLSPVGLYFLASRVSGRRDIGLCAALCFSLLSPSAFLAQAIHADLGSYWAARRFQALAFYGEGPNVSGLSLVPFALWGIHAVYEKLTALRFILASLALALVVLISWPASVALAMGALAYLLSRDWLELRGRLGSLALLALTAYLLICPLDPPSTIRDNQRNSQLIGGPYHYTRAHILYFTLLALALFAVRFWGRRAGAPRFVVFSLNWALLPGAVALTAFWTHTALLPQPERFHVAMEIGISLLLGAAIAYGLAALRRLPLARAAVFALLVICALWQGYRYHRYVRALTPPFDVTATEEYRVSQWLNGNLPGQRVFAAGSTSFWMNVWSDQPQVTGCCLPGLPNPMSWIVGYIIPSDDGAAGHEAEYALLWLRAYGASAVKVGGAATRDAYHDWTHPNKFDGILPLIWHEGDDRIYRIPARSTSLAHVVRPAELASRAPANGIDVEPLRAFVAALDDPARPLASWAWLDSRHASITADLAPGDLVSVQQTFVPGWHAASHGRALDIRRDPLGLIVVDPRTSGHVTLDVFYDGGRERKVLLAACALGWLGMLTAGALALTRRARTPLY